MRFYTFQQRNGAERQRQSEKIVILKDDYTTDTLSIKDDLLGVAISYRPINFMTVDLLRQRFFGYSVKKEM